ncbi:MAG: hypothetical protein IKG79_02595 [Neisseriaceae bacterium]|nr:hypothetical protein [Neisseriaceae bacterium]
MKIKLMLDTNICSILSTKNQTVAWAINYPRVLMPVFRQPEIKNVLEMVCCFMV